MIENSFLLKLYRNISSSVFKGKIMTAARKSLEKSFAWEIVGNATATAAAWLGKLSVLDKDYFGKSRIAAGADSFWNKAGEKTAGSLSASSALAKYAESQSLVSGRIGRMVFALTIAATAGFAASAFMLGDGLSTQAMLYLAMLAALAFAAQHVLENSGALEKSRILNKAHELWSRV